MVSEKLKKIKSYGSLVMFSHTLFSLPFAMISMLWAAQGIPSVRTLFWIVAALAGARNGANALNRLIDRRIDARNPRTSGRHLPSGTVKTGEVVGLAAFCFGVYVLSAFMLNPLCAVLSPLPLAVFFLYSYTKRFTWACHLVLGIACGGAPVGAWMAVRGNIGWPSLVLGAAVTLWVAGFDIIYAVQDVSFDRREDLYSIPSVFGVKKALIVSCLFHIAATALLAHLYFYLDLGPLYAAGTGIVGLLLLFEHILAASGGQRRIKIASYGINQIVSTVFLLFGALDMFLG